MIEASTVAHLAERLNLPLPALAQSFADVEAAKRAGTMDRFGRNFAGAAPLTPPFRAVKVTGALFHTQAAVLQSTRPRAFSMRTAIAWQIFLPPGGAAAGVSGLRASGYLSGNGLLTATVLGRVAGQRRS